MKIVKPSLVFMAIAVVALAQCMIRPASAENSACWGDESRRDISCVAITESLLLGIRGQTTAFVQRTFRASGRDVPGGVHFLSNYSKGKKTGGGTVNIIFVDGRAESVSASVDVTNSTKALTYIWSAYEAPTLDEEIDTSTRDYRRTPFCSDLSAKFVSCEGGSIEDELTKLRMEGGMSRADLLKALDVACNLEGTSDPKNDCDRVREKLQ